MQLGGQPEKPAFFAGIAPLRHMIWDWSGEAMTDIPM